MIGMSRIALYCLYVRIIGMRQQRYNEFWNTLKEAYPVSKGEVRIPIASSFVDLGIDTHVFMVKLENILKQALAASTKYAYEAKIESQPFKKLLGDGLTGVVRFDCVVDARNEIKVLELNTDYPDGLLMHDYTYSALSGKNSKKHLDMFLSLFDTKKTIYIAHAKEQSFVDAYYLEKQLLEAHGFRVFIGAPEELSVRDTKVFFKEYEINVIRRCLEMKKINSEIIDRLSRTDVSFINTVDLRLAGLKSLLSHIEHPYIPKTYVLDDTVVAQITHDKDRFIIKPYDGAEGFDIYFGKDMSVSRWEELVKKHVNSNYIAQEFINLKKKKLEFYDNGGVFEKEVYFDLCPHFFVKRGEVIGSGYILVRFSENKIVNVTQGGGVGYIKF